jgi:hypothetical protein
MRNSGYKCSEKLFTNTEFFEIDSWRLVRCTTSLHDYAVGSVLENGSVCYAGMARIHMLRLDRVQYRDVRIALRLMCSNPSNSMAKHL